MLKEWKRLAKALRSLIIEDLCDEEAWRKVVNE